MSKLLFIFLAFAGFFCLSINGANCQTEVPKYRVDLDQPAETRWLEIGHDFATYSPYLKMILEKKIPPSVFPLAEKVALYLDTIFEQPYPGELRSIAKAFNMTLPDVILLNIFYDLTAYCTSIVAQDDQGDIYHARNLDYDNADILRNISVHIDFLQNGKVAYSGVTFVGFIGILTGQKPLAFTVTLDERDKGFVWENVFMLLLAKTTPVSFFLRSLLANKDSNFDYAVQEISKVEMIAPAYIIVGGVGKEEGAVVTRNRINALDVWKLNTSEGRWFLVETNYDHWLPPPPGDDRRDPAIKAMNEMGQKNVGVKELFNVMSTKPVLNSGTVYTTIMSAKFPTVFTTWRRDCC